MRFLQLGSRTMTFQLVLILALALLSMTGCATRTVASPRPTAGGFWTELDLTHKPGVVFPSTHVALPGGKGAFPSNVDTGDSTGPTPTITVTAGFSYTFACFVPGDRAKLVFAAANPIPGGDAVRVSITSQVGALVPRLLFSEVLPQTLQNQEPRYHPYTLPLPPSRECTHLTFSVKAVAGGTGAWATFVGPTVKGLPG